MTGRKNTESRQKIYEIQREIIDCPDLFQKSTSLTFVRKDLVLSILAKDKKPTKRYFYLFNEMLVYATEQLHGQARYEGKIPLKQSEVEDLPASDLHENIFSITRNSVKMTFLCATADDKLSFMFEISKQLSVLKLLQTASDTDSKGKISTIKSGNLVKQGHKFKTWRKRWFVLKGNGNLLYYNLPEDATPAGTIQLEFYFMKKGDFEGKQFAIMLEHSSGIGAYYFHGESQKDIDHWYESLYPFALPAEARNKAAQGPKKSFGSVRRLSTSVDQKPGWGTAVGEAIATPTWIEFIDEEGQTMYYYNTATGQTSNSIPSGYHK